MKEAVTQAIDSERRYQDRKFPNSRHTCGEWLLILQKLLDDARRVWMEKGDVAAMEEVRQVAAVAVAAMESLGASPRISFCLQSEGAIGTSGNVGNFPGGFAVVSTLEDQSHRNFVRVFPTREAAVQWGIEYLKFTRPQLFDGATSEQDVLATASENLLDFEWFFVTPALGLMRENVNQCSSEPERTSP